MKFNLKNTIGFLLILAIIAVNIFFFIVNDLIDTEDLVAWIGFIALPSVCILLFLYKTAIKKLKVSENKGAKIFGILSFVLASILACFMIFILIEDDFDSLAALLLIFAIALLIYGYLISSFPFHKQSIRQIEFKVSYDVFFKTALLVFIGIFLVLYYFNTQNGKYVINNSTIINTRTGETYYVSGSKPIRQGSEIRD